MPDVPSDRRALTPTRPVNEGHALLRIASTFAIYAAIVLSALACSADAHGLGDAATLVIPGEYRGVAYELRLAKFADDNDEFARLACVFFFEDPARHAASAAPSWVDWTTATGDRFMGPLVSVWGVGPAIDDDHIVRFEVEVPRTASGGHLDFGMSDVGFPRLERGSRELRVELTGKVVPIVSAR